MDAVGGELKGYLGSLGKLVQPAHRNVSARITEGLQLVVPSLTQGQV